MTAMAKEIGWLVFAWISLAVGLFAAVWVITMAVTGAPPPACGGVPVPFERRLDLAFAAATGLGGATVVVGGYWARGARRWWVRLPLLALVALLAVFLVGVGGGMGLCMGGYRG
jgi:hypothetical protein